MTRDIHKVGLLLSDKITKIWRKDADFPAILRQISDPPACLYVRGRPPAVFLGQPRLAIVGSRKMSAYGKAVTTRLAGELARLGVVIVSGLAIGVDGAAHRAALEVGGTTVAVLACGVDRIYPNINYQLGLDILRQGGAVISEYPPGTIGYKDQFVARNRLISGLSDGVLVTEAAARSGSLHTAQFALEQDREVLAVPGNITSATSGGTNNLIKSGATPVTELADILHAMNWEHLQAAPKKPSAKGGTPEEQLLLDLIASGLADGAELLSSSHLDVSDFNQTLTMLEITGKIRPLGNNQWGLY